MRALILDMYGVIMKDPECGFMPFVNRAFPDLSCEEIYKYWDKADLGEMSSLDFLRKLGFKGDLSKIEKEFLDTAEIDESFLTSGKGFSLKPGFIIHLLLVNILIYCLNSQITLPFGKPHTIL